MTPPALVVLLRNAANSAGVAATVTAPKRFIASWRLAPRSDLRISPLKRPTIAAGVPARRARPTQGRRLSKPTPPRHGGTSGKSGWRTGVPTEMTFVLRRDLVGDAHDGIEHEGDAARHHFGDAGPLP